MKIKDIVTEEVDMGFMVDIDADYNPHHLEYIQKQIHRQDLINKNFKGTAIFKKPVRQAQKSFDKDPKVLTVRLKKLAKTYPSKEFLEKTLMHPNYNLGYRLLAAAARKVADRLNDLDPTELFRAVLAQSSMIQVYAKTQKRGDSLAFVNFRVVFPATFTGTIVFDAQTNFFSTQPPKGRISFKLKG